MDKILQFVVQLLAQLPALIEAGVELREFLDEKNAQINDMIAKGRQPTEEEWNSLNAFIAQQRAKLHGVEPQKQTIDPDEIDPSKL